MAINFNSYPYFDDYDPEKNFYKILFKPGYAVQSRELNQLQSISQHQISTFANHIFKKNSMVIPGGVVLNTKAGILFVTNINVTNLIGKTITNAPLIDGFYPNTAGYFDNYITAVVLGSSPATDDYPTCLYIKYFNSYNVTGEENRMHFLNTDTVYTIEDNPTQIVIDIKGANVGKVVSIDKGVFYTKELFVDVYTQNLIVEPENNTITNCIIGLNIIESIVDSYQDESLLDNAQGHPNQYAPGADRYKIELILTRTDKNTIIDEEKFIQLMTIENDVITYLNNNTQYAELLKTLAKRTYDANGNFIVNGLKTSVNKSYTDDYIWVGVGRGDCYLGGYEYNQLHDVNIPIAKPRDIYHTEEKPLVSTFLDNMPFFYVAGGNNFNDLGVEQPFLTHLPEKNELVQFINNRPGPGITSNVVGYGVYKELQYYAGDIADNIGEKSTAIYKMYFDNITIESGYSINDIGGYKKIGAEDIGAPILCELNISGAVTTFEYFDNSGDGDMFSNTNMNIFAADDINNPPLSWVPYYVTYNKIYVIKTLKTNKILSSEVIRNINYSATLVSAFITNYSNEYYPLIKLDNSTIKTTKRLDNNEVINDLSYSVIKAYDATITTNGVDTGINGFRVDSEPSSYFEDYSINDYSAFKKTVAGYINIPLGTGIIKFNSTFTTLSFHAPNDIAINTDIVLYTTLIKNEVAHSNNSPETATVVIPTPSKSWIALGHQNIQEILSIKDSGDINVAPNINNSIDITNRYIFESGANATSINTGFIKLKRNNAPPIGQISVNYTYYKQTDGSYSCVDSYGDFRSDDLSYIGRIRDVKGNNKETVNIRNCIDFRTTYSNYFFKNYGRIIAANNLVYLKDINLSLFAARFSDINNRLRIIGPGIPNGADISSISINSITGDSVINLTIDAIPASGTYYIGLTSNNSLVDTTAVTYGLGKEYTYPKDLARITYSYTKFLPKHIHLYVNREKDSLKIDHKEVSGYQEILQFRRNEYKLPLAYIYMYPYTIDINEVSIEKFANPVYKMLDIHDIKERVDRNEYYTSLALNRDMHQEIVDATVEGATEAARGMWNEDFEDAFSQDYNSDDYKCTIYDKSYLSPGVITRTINLSPKSTEVSGNYKQTGSTVTLPYTEVKAFGNTPASTFNNLNPYNTMNWEGKLSLNPMVDNWVDTVTLPVVIKPITIKPDELPTPPIDLPEIIPMPPVYVLPPVILPPPPEPIEEIVIEISNLRKQWGKDSKNGYHAITFDWKTNLGRTGRVNTDSHLSLEIRRNGWDGVYAKSLKNKKYKDIEVKSYLHAGRHFDQKDPSKWRV